MTLACKVVGRLQKHLNYCTLYLLQKVLFRDTYKNQNTGETVKKGSYAIKELKHSTDKEKSSHVKRVLGIENEVCNALRALNEPENKEFNIVQPKQIITCPSVGYIVTEYCSGGDLARYLKSECEGERLPEIETKDIMAQVTKGKCFQHPI